MQSKRIVQRLKDHDWMAVAIEILIVVVGVLIALQVSNWNDDRKDSARGEDYLRRMHADLRQDADSIAKISVFRQQVYDYGMAALAYAEHGTPYRGSAWKTVLAYYQASQVWPYRIPDTTFQEIRSKGELDLIRNPALRKHVSNHYGNSSASQVVEVLGVIPKYREDVRGMTPWAIQQYIWTKCYDADTGANQQLLDCPSPATEAEAQALLEQYRQSSRLTEELRFWMANVSTSQILMSRIQSEAEGLDKEIRDELARHGK
jgi:hypothetical protein